MMVPSGRTSTLSAPACFAARRVTVTLSAVPAGGLVGHLSGIAAGAGATLATLLAPAVTALSGVAAGACIASGSLTSDPVTMIAGSAVCPGSGSATLLVRFPGDLAGSVTAAGAATGTGSGAASLYAMTLLSGSAAAAKKAAGRFHLRSPWR